MKDLFKGFYHPTPDEIGSLWQNAVIVFDTNVLLDFYRVSTTGYTEMMSLLRMSLELLYLIRYLMPRGKSGRISAPV